MITNSLLNQLCHLAQTPDSIKTIRAFVLQAAMSGRLSGIVPGDTTLYDLEQIINAERKARGYKKALRAIYTSDVILTSESIPSHWRWYKFGDIAHHNAGKMLNKGRQSTGRETEYITTSNLYWGYFKLDGLRKMPIRDNELERCTATKGDLLICEGGEAGRAAVWPHNHLIAFQNHVHRARPFGGISPYYLQLYFWKLKATGEIAKHRKGVGITSMSGKTLSEILIPLPPLAEQKRIVAKVDELMALCARLESQLKERDVKQAALLEAMVAELTDGNSA
jgi:type I restriction enzyme S subunit